MLNVSETVRDTDTLTVKY